MSPEDKAKLIGHGQEIPFESYVEAYERGLRVYGYDKAANQIVRVYTPERMTEFVDRGDLEFIWIGSDEVMIARAKADVEIIESLLQPDPWKLRPGDRPEGVNEAIADINDEPEKLYLVGACGEVFDDMKVAYDHVSGGPDIGEPCGDCCDAGGSYHIVTESEAF